MLVCCFQHRFFFFLILTLCRIIVNSTGTYPQVSQLNNAFIGSVSLGLNSSATSSPTAQTEDYAPLFPSPILAVHSFSSSSTDAVDLHRGTQSIRPGHRSSHGHSHSQPAVDHTLPVHRSVTAGTGSDIDETVPPYAGDGRGSLEREGVRDRGQQEGKSGGVTASIVSLRSPTRPTVSGQNLGGGTKAATPGACSGTFIARVYCILPHLSSSSDKLCDNYCSPNFVDGSSVISFHELCVYILFKEQYFNFVGLL